MKKLILLFSITLLIQGQSFASLPKTGQPHASWSTSTVLVGLAGLAGVGFGGYYYNEIWKPSIKAEATKKVVSTILTKFARTDNNIDQKHRHDQIALEESVQWKKNIADSYVPEIDKSLSKNGINVEKLKWNEVIDNIASSEQNTDSVQQLVGRLELIKPQVNPLILNLAEKKQTFWSVTKWTSGIAAVVGLGYFFSKK